MPLVGRMTGVGVLEPAIGNYHLPPGMVRDWEILEFCPWQVLSHGSQVPCLCVCRYLSVSMWVETPSQLESRRVHEITSPKEEAGMA